MKRFFFRFSLSCTVLSILVAGFFYTKVRERNRYIDDLILTVGVSKATMTNEAIVLALSNEIWRETLGPFRESLDWYANLESRSLFNVTSAVGLRYPGYGIANTVHGPCGTSTRLLLNSLWRLDLPARKLLLLDNEDGMGGGHTLIEFLHEGRWRVIAPSDSSFVWRKSDGEIATVEEIQADSELFATIYDYQGNWPYLFDNPRHIRWEKFPKFMTRPFQVLLGRDRYENAYTPKIYDLPRTLLFASSLAAALCFGLIAFITRPRLQDRQPPLGPQQTVTPPK